MITYPTLVPESSTRKCLQGLGFGYFRRALYTNKSISSVFRQILWILWIYDRFLCVPFGPSLCKLGGSWQRVEHLDFEMCAETTAGGAGRGSYTNEHTLRGLITSSFFENPWFSCETFQGHSAPFGCWFPGGDIWKITQVIKTA